MSAAVKVTISPHETLSMKKLLGVILGFTGVSAIICGALLIAYPDGSALGLPLYLLEPSPFNDFFIPGIVLTFVVGGSQLYALISNARRAGSRNYSVEIAGILLGGWIVVQMIMIRQISWLHLIYLSIGALQATYGWLQTRKTRNLTG